MNFRLPATWDRVVRVLLDVAVLMLAFIFLFSVVSIFGLSATFVALQSGRAPAGWAGWITDLLLRAAGGRPSDAALYTAAVSFFAGVVPVTASLVFTVLPLTVFYRQRRIRREQQSLHLVEIREPGRDDLAVMWRYYKQAEEIIVFSGDFSWIKTGNQEMTEKLRQLGHRVTYVSSKKEAEVAAAVEGALFAELEGRFVFESNVALKCSFVRVNGGAYFLYKSDVPTADGAKPAVCVLTPTQESRVLLGALEAFCNQYRTPR